MQCSSKKIKSKKAKNQKTKLKPESSRCQVCSLKNEGYKLQSTMILHSK